MALISYAQNFEDIMLWRALGHIENGFYIDVGANDPTIESVTKLFYDKGWHGINIEPLSKHFLDLQKERPRDINLQCAASNHNGEIEIWEFDVRGWATTSTKALKQHKESGYKSVSHMVPSRRLTDICDEYRLKDIHFLKIDVEGHEESVIDGLDLSRFRPWVLVVEATEPNSTQENYAKWESRVIAANYSLCYADGLNRFYIAKEQYALKDAFRYPPNVFDNFVRVDHLRALSNAQHSQEQMQRAQERAQAAEEQAKREQERAQAAEERYSRLAETKIDPSELHAILASRSWRLTAPLRWCGHQTRLLRQAGVKVRIKFITKKLIARTITKINNNPLLKGYMVSCAKQLGIRNWLQRLAMKARIQEPHNNKYQELPIDTQQLTPHARRIYAQLKSTIEEKHKGQRQCE
tara:strand:- start:9 stop:1235 length:1227 start_codon:yes stop_codon:yes gene_type:complete